MEELNFATCATSPQGYYYYMYLIVTAPSEREAIVKFEQYLKDSEHAHGHDYTIGEIASSDQPETYEWYRLTCELECPRDERFREVFVISSGANG